MKTELISIRGNLQSRENSWVKGMEECMNMIQNQLPTNNYNLFPKERIKGNMIPNKH